MCRTSPPNQYLENLEKLYKNKEGGAEEEEKHDPKMLYMYLKDDAVSKEAKHDGHPQKGYSVMIFACQTSKATLDGELIKFFMDEY